MPLASFASTALSRYFRITNQFLFPDMAGVHFVDTGLLVQIMQVTPQGEFSAAGLTLSVGGPPLGACLGSRVRLKASFTPRISRCFRPAVTMVQAPQPRFECA